MYCELDNPDDYEDNLEKASTLWVFGTNLKRIFQEDDREQYLRRALQHGCKINALLVSPEPPHGEPAASTFTAMQDAQLESDSVAIKTEIQQIKSNLVRLSELRKPYPNSVVIKTINYPLAFGIDGIDIETWRGIIYVRYYPFLAGDRPIVCLNHGDNVYDFYKEQIEKLWSHGIEWPRIKKATLDRIGKIASFALRIDYARLTRKQREGFGFIFADDESEYSKFVNAANWFYLLESGEEVIGFVLAHSNALSYEREMEVYAHLSTLAGDNFVIVRQICVGIDYAHRGFGRALYDHLFKEIESSNNQHRTAYTFIWKQPANGASENFHRELGWKEIEKYQLKKPLSADRCEVGIWAREIY